MNPIAKRRFLLYLWSMKSSTTDRMEGAGQTAKGNARAAIGKLTDNQKMRDRGMAEQISGKIQSKIGDIKKVFGK